MTNILDQIKGAFAKQEADRIGSYRELVRKVAGDNQIAAAEAAEILKAAGKSPADFEGDVQTYRNRKQWAAELKDAEGVPAAMASLDDKSRMIAAALEEAKVRHDRDMEPLYNERRRLDAIVSVASVAKKNLERTAGPESDKELHAVREELKKAHQRYRAIEEKVKRNSVNIGTIEANIEKEDDFEDAYRRDLEAARNRMAKYNAELLEAGVTLRRLQGEEEAILRRALEA